MLEENFVNKPIPSLKWIFIGHISLQESNAAILICKTNLHKLHKTTIFLTAKKHSLQLQNYISLKNITFLMKN